MTPTNPAGATARLWSLCGQERGGCVCMQIHGKDAPVAVVTSGKWGDDYPSIRLEGESLFPTAVPYMAQITYGEITEEEAKANAALIVEAVNGHDTLKAEVKSLKSLLRKIDTFMSERVVKLLDEHRRDLSDEWSDYAYDLECALALPLDEVNPDATKTGGVK